jgi:hypothetical protein
MDSSKEKRVMLNSKIAKRFGRVFVGGLLFVAMAGPAMAGTVYSWVTEDGTYAFTDDPKRIPAVHKDDAQARPMGDLKRYGRYTVDHTDKNYTDRLRQRQSDLREQAAQQAPMVSSAPAMGSGAGLNYAVPFIGGGSPGGHRGAQMQMGLGALGGANGGEPFSIESIRMQPSKGQATRHVTVIKQGDRIVGVIKGEIRDRSPEGVSEEDLGL